MKKLPKAAVAPSAQKGVPRVAAHASEDARDGGTQRPAWQFSSVDCSGCFAWPRCDMLWIKDLTLKLAQFESMTWKEIQAAGSHFVSTGGMSPDARHRLRDIQQDDLDELYSLRIKGKQRVYGVREGRVLRFLWWDPGHKVYPSVKKNT